MTWQSIAWADPDLFSKRDLQPESMFDAPNKNSGFAVSLAGYILGVLSRIETVGDNRNLYSMKLAVDGTLRSLKETGKIPEGMEDMVPLTTEGSPESGAFVIDLGDTLVRYYNQKMPGAGEAGEGFRVLEDVKVGEYISRQVLTRARLADGLVAKGEDALLYDTFVKGAYVTGALRASLVSRMPEFISRIKSILSSSAIKEDTRSVLEAAVEKLSAASFVEFKPLVIRDEKDPTVPSAWLLGFSTIHFTGEGQGEPLSKLETMLGTSFPDTVGLSTRLVDIIGDDDLLFLEYLFHEAACSSIGHQKAREMQEILFPENYGRVYGDTRPGHKDGELALILKQVVWEGCAQPSHEELDGNAINADFAGFQEHDFTKDGPQQATRYYSRYKKWYEWVRRSMVVNLSRLKKGDYEQVVAILGSMDERYQYVLARVAWAWNMHLSWAKADDILRDRDFGLLTVEEKARVKGYAEDLLAAHKEFMKTSPFAKYLENDLFVEIAIGEIEEILGKRKIGVHFVEEPEIRIPVKVVTEEPVKAEAKKEAAPKEEVKPASTEVQKEVPEERPSEAVLKRVLLFDWKTLAWSMAASLAVSGILYLILPVNTATQLIAFVVPLALFIYLLARNWSWTNLIIAVGISAVLSFVLPVPWLGLSIAIVTLAVMAVRKPSAGIPAGKVRKDAPKASAQGAAKQGQEGAPPRSAGDGKTKEGGVSGSQGINISRDIFSYFWRIIKAMNKGAKAEPSGSKEVPEVDTHTILDALFLSNIDKDRIKVDPGLKNALRPLVRKQLAQLEGGFNFEIKKSMNKLSSWRSESDDALVEAFSEVTQEVAASITSWSFGEDNRHEILVIQELVREYYGIEKSRYGIIRLKLVVNMLREQIRSEEMIGSASAENYYFLGLLEFHFRNYEEAESLFGKAVRTAPADAEYLFTYGILEHFLKKWDNAGKAYRFSLNLRQLEPKKTEADKLKVELLELLIKKIDGKTGLDGVSEKGEERAPSAIPLLKKIISSGGEPSEYAVTTAPLVEEAVFTAAPFAVLASLMIAGLLTFWGLLAGMAVSYCVFVTLHITNLSRAPERYGSLSEKLRYALAAPLKVAGMDMTAAAAAGSLLSMVMDEAPGFASSMQFMIFLAGVIYVIAYNYHRSVNISASSEGSAPAALDEEAFKHIEPRDYNRVARCFFVAGINTRFTTTGSELVREIARKAYDLKAARIRQEDVWNTSPEDLIRSLVIAPARGVAADKNWSDAQKSMRKIREMLYVNGIEEICRAIGIEEMGTMDKPFSEQREARPQAARIWRARTSRPDHETERNRKETEEKLKRFRREREKFIARKNSASAVAGYRILDNFDEAEKRLITAMVYFALSRKAQEPALKEKLLLVMQSALIDEANLSVPRDNPYAKKQIDSFLQRRINFGPRIVADFCRIIRRAGDSGETQLAFVRGLVAGIMEHLREKSLDDKLVEALRSKVFAVVEDVPFDVGEDGFVKNIDAAILSVLDPDMKAALLRVEAFYLSREGRGGTAPASIPLLRDLYERIMLSGTSVRNARAREFLVTRGFVEQPDGSFVNRTTFKNGRVVRAKIVDSIDGALGRYSAVPFGGEDEFLVSSRAFDTFEWKIRDAFASVIGLDTCPSAEKMLRVMKHEYSHMRLRSFLERDMPLDRRADIPLFINEAMAGKYERGGYEKAAAQNWQAITRARKNMMPGSDSVWDDDNFERTNPELARLFAVQDHILTDSGYYEGMPAGPVHRILGWFGFGRVRSMFTAPQILRGYALLYDIKERAASGRKPEKKEGVAGGSVTDAIVLTSKGQARQFASVGEYPVKVAPWIEEGIFFAIPLVAGHFLFGIGSIGTMVLMAVFRTVFFIMHEGARPHAPPSDYIIALTAAMTGFAAFLPLYVLGIFSPIAAFSLIIPAFLVSAFIHRELNIGAVQLRLTPAAIQPGKSADAGTAGDTPLSEMPFYKAWQKVIAGERPGIEEPTWYTKDYLESVPEGKDFLQNNNKIQLSLRYLFDGMNSEERKAAMKHITAIATANRLDEWKLSDFEKLHALRAMARSLLVAISIRHDVPDDLKRLTRGVVYGISLLALYAENSICAARLKVNAGMPFEMPGKYLVEDPGSLPAGLTREEYEDALAGMRPYYYVFDSKVRESLRGKDLYKMAVVGSLMEAYTAKNLPFVVKRITEGGQNSFREPGDFDRDVLEPVMIARRKLGGLAANALPVENLRVSVEGREEVFDKAIIQREVIPLKYMFTIWDWQDNDPPEKIAANKARIDKMMAQWWQLQEEMHKRGVIDLDPKITDNYGYDEERDTVVILDFSHITDEKDRLRWDRVFGMDNLISYYEGGNKKLLWERDSFNSISYGISKYEEGLEMFAPRKRIKFENGEITIEGWPSEEDINKEELFIPLGDPFRVDAREMSEMTRYIEDILNIKAGKSVFSPEFRESVLRSVHRSMLWLYSIREREEMMRPATIPLLRQGYEYLVRHVPGRTGKKDLLPVYAVNIAPFVEEGIFFALPLVMGHFMFGIGNIGTMVLMAAFRAVFFILHDGARPHAPPSAYIIALTAAITGFSAFLPLYVLGIFSPLSASALIIPASMVSALIHRELNLSAVRRGLTPAVITTGGLSPGASDIPAEIKQAWFVVAKWESHIDTLITGKAAREEELSDAIEALRKNGYVVGLIPGSEKFSDFELEVSSENLLLMGSREYEGNLLASGGHMFTTQKTNGPGTLARLARIPYDDGYGRAVIEDLSGFVRRSRHPGGMTLVALREGENYGEREIYVMDSSGRFGNAASLMGDEAIASLAGKQADIEIHSGKKAFEWNGTSFSETVSAAYPGLLSSGTLVKVIKGPTRPVDWSRSTASVRASIGQGYKPSAAELAVRSIAADEALSKLGLELGEIAGAGENGIIIKAVDASGKAVAIKVFAKLDGKGRFGKRDPGFGPEISRQFEKEVRTISALDGSDRPDSIPRIISKGELAGYDYYATEFFDGIDLDTLRRSGGLYQHFANISSPGGVNRDGTALLAEAMIQAVKANRYMADNGVDHGNKPRNIMLRVDIEDGQYVPHIMFVDFGDSTGIDAYRRSRGMLPESVSAALSGLINDKDIRSMDLARTRILSSYREDHDSRIAAILSGAPENPEGAIASLSDIEDEGMLLSASVKGLSRKGPEETPFEEEPTAVEGVPGFDLVKTTVNSILPDVQVIEEKYTPASHLSTYVRELRDAWHGKQYGYILADVIILLFQLRVPNAQWIYTEDGKALEKIVIRSGGWSFGPLLAAAGIGIIVSGAMSVSTLLFFAAVIMMAGFGADIAFDVLLARASRSHEWLHAYQGKIAEKARRDGRIGNIRDFLNDNMSALEMISKFNHRAVTEAAIDEVREFVEERIDVWSREKEKAAFEELDKMTLPKEARAYFPDGWMKEFKAEKSGGEAAKKDYAKFISGIDAIFSKGNEKLKEDFVRILSDVGMKGYLESTGAASEEAKAEAYGAVTLFVETASGPDGYAYCEKVISNMKMLSEFGVVKKEDFKFIFRSAPFAFLRILFNDRSAEKYLVFATLMDEGYLTYKEFMRQAVANFYRAGDFYEKITEKDAMTSRGTPKLSSYAVEFFGALGGKKAFSSAWNRDMIELLIAVSGGRDTAAYYVVPAFSWTEDPLRHAVGGLEPLEKMVGREDMRRLWEADPAQFINILAYFRETFGRSKDVEGDFNRHFDRVRRVTGKEPAEFLREVWADLAANGRGAFERPFGLEIEILQEQAKKYGMERPVLAEEEHPYDTAGRIEEGLSNPDPEAKRFMIFLMMMQMNVKGETSASLHPNDPNVRMMELVPPLFWDYGSGQRFVGYLKALGLVGPRTPMDINIVLPDNTDMDALRRFQFVKHILYTPEERLRQFGDILKPDLRESIRTKEDFTSIREKDNDGGFSRFEDRLNSCNEGSLKYHQLMWEAFMRSPSDSRLRSALDKYDAKLRGWFADVMFKRSGFPEWAKGWLASAGIDYTEADAPGDIGMKLAAIDIGLPDNKEKFLYFIGKLDEKECEALRTIVNGTLLEIDGILSPGKDQTLPETSPGLSGRSASDKHFDTERREEMLAAIRQEVDSEVERLGDLSRVYRYKDEVHRPDYTFISDRYYRLTTPDGLTKMLSSMKMDPERGLTGSGVLVNSAASQKILRWDADEFWRFLPGFTEETNVALEFVPSRAARERARIVASLTGDNAFRAAFDDGLDLRPSAGMVSGRMRVIVRDTRSLPEIIERVKQLQPDLKAAGLEVEVISMPVLDTEMIMQRNAYHRVVEKNGAQRAKELREKIKRGDSLKILFVCLMNQQRSFLMQMASEKLIREENMPNISVSSRGIIDFSGYPHDGLKEACAKKGVDPTLLNTFRTKGASEEDLRDADYVIMSDEMVSDNLSSSFPQYAGKLLYISDVAPQMVTGMRSLVDAYRNKAGLYLPDYTAVADKLSGEQYFDIVYSALRTDLFGLPPRGENAETEKRGTAGTALELEEVKGKVSGILAGLGYSAESLGKMPYELVLLGYEVRRKFPNLKAQISSQDIKAARKTLQEMVWFLKDRGYKDIVNPNTVTRYLVNAPGDEDIFEAIALARDVPKDKSRRAADQLVTCASLSQVMYIALELLEVENVGAVYAPEHIMLSVGLSPGRMLIIDPAMAEFREIETGKYYDTSTGTAYMNLKMQYRLRPKAEGVVLARFYYYLQAALPGALTASKCKNRGDAYAIIGKNDRAITEYVRALELNPNDADVRIDLGDIYFRSGDLIKAIEEYSTALKLNAASGTAYFKRGNTFMKTAEFEKAAEDYKAAMKYMEVPDEAEEMLAEAFEAIREKNSVRDNEKSRGRAYGPVTMGDFTIDDPVPDDAPAIKELSKEIFGDYDAITVPYIIRTIDEARYQGAPVSYIKVCRAQGKVVGYILAKADFAAEIFESGSPDMWLNIRQIAVHKDFRKQGIGGMLCDSVVDLARADGYEILCMSTSSEYSSRIAERRGFVYDTFAGMYVLKSDRSEPGAERTASDPASPFVKQVMVRAAYVIPALVNSLITISRKNEKTVLAIDLGLGEGEVNAMIKQLMEALPSVEGNNEDLKRFFRNLEIIKGEGASLAARVSNLTDPEKGSVRPENVIVITKNDNVKLYGSVEGRGIIAGIDDGGFSKAAYMPLFEIMLFAVGKSLGWSEKTLKEHYAMIPNVIASEKLSPEELSVLFGSDKKTLVIRLIPDAVEFDEKEFMEVIHSLKIMLARA